MSDLTISTIKIGARHRKDRGDIAALAESNPPLPIQAPASVIEAPVGQHSEKPGIVRDAIVSMYPTGRKLELFARGPAVEGWHGWGNEAISASTTT